jgi:CRP-like cAMP-binding protein
MLLRTSQVPELAEIPAFMPMRDETLRRIERRFQRRSFDVNEMVIAEGARGDEVFIIVSGHAVVDRCGGELARLGPGDWFGELAVLLDLPRNATVRALTPLHVFALSRASFFDLLLDVPDLWRRLAATLARRLRQADLAS